MRSFSSLVRPLIFVTIPLLILAIVLRYLLPAEFYTPALPYLVLFVFSSQIVLLRFIAGGATAKFNRFVNRFMAGSFLKLLLYLIVILVYSYLNRHEALPFAVSFVVLYLIYTIFEISVLLKYFKTQL